MYLRGNVLEHAPQRKGLMPECRSKWRSRCSLRRNAFPQCSQAMALVVGSMLARGRSVFFRVIRQPFQTIGGVFGKSNILHGFPAREGSNACVGMPSCEPPL